MSEYRPGHLFLSRKFWPGIYSSPASIPARLLLNCMVILSHLALFPIQNQSFTAVSAHAQADGCQSRGHHVYKAVWTPSYNFHLDIALTHLCSFATWSARSTQDKLPTTLACKCVDREAYRSLRTPVWDPATIRDRSLLGTQPLVKTCFLDPQPLFEPTFNMNIYGN